MSQQCPRVHELAPWDTGIAGFEPGDRLPSERDLCTRFGVSRATMRRAIGSLVTDGLVVRRAGLGNFVAQAAIGEVTGRLMSFTELAASRSLVPSSIVLCADVRAATLDEADEFGIAPSADLFILKRVRRLDGIAVSIDSSRVPLVACPSPSSVDFASASLYEVLDEAGAGPARADYTLQAVVADEADATLLDTEVGHPLLVATTASYTETGTLVELGEMRYRGDCYRFDASLTR